MHLFINLQLMAIFIVFNYDSINLQINLGINQIIQTVRQFSYNQIHFILLSKYHHNTQAQPNTSILYNPSDKNTFVQQMSNISQNNSTSSALLQYSTSSSDSHPNHDRLTNSLQYLDHVRSINKKIYTQQNKSNPLASTISPLEKLINSKRDITYIDNQKIYGIIKIQMLEKDKLRVKELEEILQKIKINQQDLELKNESLQNQLTNVRQNQDHLKKVVSQLRTALQQKINKAKILQKKSQIQTACLHSLMNEKIQDSKKFLGLQSDYQNLKTKSSIENNSYSTSQTMICQTQSQYIQPTLIITPFQPKLQQIIRKIRQKQGQKLSKLTLKQIISQSLQAFVKQLEIQCDTIKQQTLDLTKLRQQNEKLIKQNQQLQDQMNKLNIEQKKLQDFKKYMTEFLDNTSQNVTKQITLDRIRKMTNLYYDSLQKQSMKHMPNYDNQLLMASNRQLFDMKEKVQFLKKENINLLRIIGEYQHKWNNMEKVIEENKNEEIGDDGTVGQLVKMSKLVKQSIKNLLQEL